MNRGLMALVGMAVMVISVASRANALEDQMKLIASSYRTVLKTDSPEEFNQELMIMKQATILAEQEIPNKLKGQDKDSTSMKDYRQGLTMLIDEIDSAKALVDAGQFDRAKQAAEQFKQLRSEYHKKYK